MFVMTKTIAFANQQEKCSLQSNTPLITMFRLVGKLKELLCLKCFKSNGKGYVADEPRDPHEPELNPVSVA